MTDLIPNFYIGDLCVSDYPFGVVRGEGGLDLGAGANIMTVIETLMLDGESVLSNGTGNRTLSLPLLVEGADLLELAQNEATLIQACEKIRNTFTLDPGDGYGPATVFDTFRIQAVHTRDDSAEAALLRRWDLTIPALPWARSATPVTQTLTPSAVATTVLDDASATTNWTATGFGQSRATATVGGVTVINVSQSSGIYGTPLDLEWTGSHPTADYVGIDVHSEFPGYDSSLAVQLRVGSTLVEAEAVEPALHGTQSYVRFWFPNPASTPYSFVIDDSSLGPTAYNSVAVGALLSSASTGFGAVLSVNTLGSVRSVGSVTCSRAGDPIEWLFLYADPQLGAFSPRLPSTWANGREGTYVVYAENAYTAGQVVQVELTDSEGRAVSTLPTRIDAEVAAMSWQPLGQVYLGGFQSGLIGAQTVAVTVDGSPVTTPSLRLFRLADDTTLTFLDGISGETVTVQSPSVDYPVGGYWVDGVDVAAKVLAPGFPVIAVPSTALFVEANDSETSPVTSTLNYPARSHTYSAV